MSKLINVKFMNDDCIETLKREENGEAIFNAIKNSPNSNDWLYKILKSNNLYKNKVYKIEDFELNLVDGDLDLESYIKLYESLKKLPRNILVDEGFWAWLNFEKFYDIAIKLMPVKTTSTIRDHYVFSKGQRRSLFFGVLSRCYFRVELTIDESLDDKYELTKFVIENPLRFRELTWREYSNNRQIVLAVLKAEKDFADTYGENTKLYPIIGKYVCELGSLMIIDILSEEDMYALVYKKLVDLHSQGGK